MSWKFYLKKCEICDRTSHPEKCPHAPTTHAQFTNPFRTHFCTHIARAKVRFYARVRRNPTSGFKPEACKKVFDALPNLKKVKVVIFDIKNLPLILKNSSVLKHLKRLNVAICSRHEGEKIDEQKFRDCLQRINCCDFIRQFPHECRSFHR